MTSDDYCNNDQVPVTRFLTGLGAMACFMTSFVLMVEHVSHSHSMLVGIGESDRLI